MANLEKQGIINLEKLTNAELISLAESLMAELRLVRGALVASYRKEFTVEDLIRRPRKNCKTCGSILPRNNWPCIICHPEWWDFSHRRDRADVAYGKGMVPTKADSNIPVHTNAGDKAEPSVPELHYDLGDFTSEARHTFYIPDS